MNCHKLCKDQVAFECKKNTKVTSAMDSPTPSSTPVTMGTSEGGSGCGFITKAHTQYITSHSHNKYVPLTQVSTDAHSHLKYEDNNMCVTWQQSASPYGMCHLVAETF